MNIEFEKGIPIPQSKKVSWNNMEVGDSIYFDSPSKAFEHNQPCG